MTSPAAELHAAIVPRLKGALAALVGDRVYDHVPRDTGGALTAAFPFVNVADFQEITDDADCISGAEIVVTIEAWSRAVGFPEVHRIASAVKAALHNADIELDDAALVALEHGTTRTLRDPDGLTSHAILEFRALVETP